MPVFWKAKWISNKNEAAFSVWVFEVPVILFTLRFCLFWCLLAALAAKLQDVQSNIDSTNYHYGGDTPHGPQENCECTQVKDKEMSSI